MNRARQANPGVAETPKKTCKPGDTPAAAAMTPVAGDDGADLEAARAGDHAAFARLYDRLAPVVLSLCRKHARAEAEDATQETFIRAYRALHKVDGPDKLRPWLFGIARRVCSERSRSARRRAKHEERFAMTRAAEQGAASAPGPAAAPAGNRDTAGPLAAVAHAEQLALLEAALDHLDDRERLAVHLYYLETDPVRAAASSLGLSRSGYYKLLARAREHLGAHMKSDSP